MRGRNWLVLGVGLLVAAVFLMNSAQLVGFGFPLDDAWIHQTYARNLAESGRWEFVPGVVSTGSTSPLWTLLLAVGYWLGLPYLWWTYALGVVCLLWLAGSGMALWRLLWPEWRRWDWLAGLSLVLTWPLVWAAVSGMETLLFAALGLWGILLVVRNTAVFSLRTNQNGHDGRRENIDAMKSAMWLGLLGGVLVLVRPEGVLVLGLMAVVLWWQEDTWQARLWGVARLAGTAVLPLLPYFAFNLWSSGHLWPNTFYAKQTEYAALWQIPLWRRFMQLLYFSLGGAPEGWRGISGAHLLLLPGMITAVWWAIKQAWTQKKWEPVLPLLWAGGHIALYAWRLPVTYQHGRYILAAIPVWVLYGLAGGFGLWASLDNPRLSWLSSRVAGLTYAVLLVFFILLGGRQYALDVAFIEHEMVATARWLAENTSPDAVIAAHDIGAIGYFGKRPLLDLAGLVSPEIIPLLNDQNALAKYIQTHNADYLVTAPGWPYEEIVNHYQLVPLYTTNYLWTREQGFNNMTVYQLKTP